MDRKSIVILVLSFAALMLWYPLTNKLFPPKPVPVEAIGETGTNAASPGVASGVTSSPARPEPVLSSAPPEIPLVVPSQAEQTLVVESDQARYVFTSYGGGLKEIQLKKFPETVGRLARKHPTETGTATLNDGAPVAAFSLVGPTNLQGDGLYTLEKVGPGVRSEKTLASGLRVSKEFQPGSDYLVRVKVRLENTGREPISVLGQEWVVGTATPMDVWDDGTLMGLQWYDGAKAEQVGDAYFQNRSFGGCLPGTPRSTFVGGNTNIEWSAVYNRFFALITIPDSNSVPTQIAVRKRPLPSPPLELAAADRRVVAKPFGLQSAFLYPDLTLAPGQSVEREFEVFAGPKEYRILDRLSSRLGHNVDLVMNFGFFGFFAKALLLSMNGLHSFGLSYGLAIILITVIIKLLFWPLTQASTRSMKRMQVLQPKIKELQEKYKDDPKKMNEKMMAFMKEHRINPAAGCFPILIQIPVFFGFYTMLQSAIELRGASFLWAFDLSQPDTVLVLFGIPINPLPLIMGGTQFWQMKLTPPSPGVDPVQQKILQYMPLIFLFILYNFSSGLTLYWTVQNLLSIAQMKLTRSTGEPVPSKAGGGGHPAPLGRRKRP